MIDNPNVIAVEFTLSQLEFLDQVKRDLNQPSIPSILRLIVDNAMPAYEAEKRKNELLRKE